MHFQRSGTKTNTHIATLDNDIAQLSVKWTVTIIAITVLTTSRHLYRLLAELLLILYASLFLLKDDTHSNLILLYVIKIIGFFSDIQYQDMIRYWETLD